MEFDAFADEIFAFSDLKEDFAYARIPRAKRQYYIAAGLNAGRAAAEQYKDADLDALLSRDGLSVRRFPKAMQGELHSQICYDGKIKQIDIFTATAGHIAAAMDKTPYPISQEDVERLFLAHEFYHWLEYSTGNTTDMQCEPVHAKLLGFFARDYRIRRTSEIAAFEFAKVWCCVPIHPKAMDYVLAYDRQNKPFSEVCERLKMLDEEYRTECLCAPAHGERSNDDE